MNQLKLTMVQWYQAVPLILIVYQAYRLLLSGSESFNFAEAYIESQPLIYYITFTLPNTICTLKRSYTGRPIAITTSSCHKIFQQIERVFKRDLAHKGNL